MLLARVPLALSLSVCATWVGVGVGIAEAHQQDSTSEYLTLASHSAPCNLENRVWNFFAPTAQPRLLDAHLSLGMHLGYLFPSVVKAEGVGVDPYTGMFLQRDPMGYEDSVNLYAGLGWDPVNKRDPTGMNSVVAVGKMLDKVTMGRGRKKWKTEKEFDVRKIKGFRKAMKKALKDYLKQYGVSDINEDTDVFEADTADEVEQVIGFSEEGGSKVYVGHSILHQPHNTKTQKMILIPREEDFQEMEGEQFGEAVRRADGKPVCIACGGGRVVVDRREGKRVEAIGPKTPIEFEFQYDWSSSGEKRRKKLGKRKMKKEAGPDDFEITGVSIKPRTWSDLHWDPSTREWE